MKHYTLVMTKKSTCMNTKKRRDDEVNPMKNKIFIHLILGTVLTAYSTAGGGSIFLNAYARTHGQSLFADDKAANIGDVLTIKISENAKVVKDR